MRLHNREADEHEQEALDRRPPCDPQVAIIVDAFHDLRGDKHMGFGGAWLIPFCAWKTWAEEYGLDWHARQLLWPVLQDVDRRHFKREQERREQEAKR